MGNHNPQRELALAERTAQLLGDAAEPTCTDSAVEWRARYAGLVSIAELDGKAVAGISGPWDGKYALTWWDRPLPSRQLELYGSMQEARLIVEAWAARMRAGVAVSPPSATTADVNMNAMVPRILADARAPLPPSTCTRLGRLMALLPVRSGPRRRNIRTIDRLRREHDLLTEIGDLHFGAIR